MPRGVLSLLVISLSIFHVSNAHEDHDGGSGSGCSLSGDAHLVAEFRPGVVTVDGIGKEWDDFDGFEFSLFPALDFDLDKAFPGGKASVKVMKLFFRYRIEEL